MDFYQSSPCSKSIVVPSIPFFCRCAQHIGEPIWSPNIRQMTRLSNEYHNGPRVRWWNIITALKWAVKATFTFCFASPIVVNCQLLWSVPFPRCPIHYSHHWLERKHRLDGSPVLFFRLPLLTDSSHWNLWQEITHKVSSSISTRPSRPTTIAAK